MKITRPVLVTISVDPAIPGLCGHDCDYVTTKRYGGGKCELLGSALGRSEVSNRPRRCEQCLDKFGMPPRGRTEEEAA